MGVSTVDPACVIVWGLTMEGKMSPNAVQQFIVPILAIAIFCYGFMEMLKRITWLNKSPHFDANLPVLPFMSGGGWGVALPWLYPENTDWVLRMFFGFVAGLFCTVIFQGVKRYGKVYLQKQLGPSAKALFPPVDEAGHTLPPTDEAQGAGEVQEKRKAS